MNGVALGAWMQANGVTRKALSKRARIHRGTVNNALNGRNLNEPSIVAIHRATGIPYETLLEEDR